MRGDKLSSMEPKWIFVRYIAGSCGIAMCLMTQTAKSVASWYNKMPAPEEIVNPIKENHERIHYEPAPPYDLSWFVRTPPFTRGDDLSLSEVKQEIFKRESTKKLVEQHKQIIVPYTKKDLPNWSLPYGKTIDVYADESMFQWLKNRRKKVFYIEKPEGIIECRYHSDYRPVPIGSNPNSFPYRKLEQGSLDSLADKRLREEYIEPSSNPTIQLTDILSGDFESIKETIETTIDDQIDAVWCKDFLRLFNQKVNLETY